jgi:hypothetical protein
MAKEDYMVAEMTYTELKDAVIRAIGNKDTDRLVQLSTNALYDDVVDDIESEMGIKTIGGYIAERRQ